MNPFRLFRKDQDFSPQVSLDLPKVPAYTPDLGWLEQFEFQLLFCPDELQRSQPEYKHISEHSAFMANAYTRKTFDYWEQRIGNTRLGIPLPASNITLGTLFPRSCRIRGEIHAVRPAAFIEIDYYKENTIRFLRKRVELLLPYRPLLNRNVSLRERHKELPLALQGEKKMLGIEKVHIIRAWMYIGNPEYWDNLLDAGWSGFKHVHSFTSKRQWLGDYTHFTKHDFED